MVIFEATQTANLTRHVGPVHCITYSSGSGQYALSGGQDRKVHLWNPVNQSCIQTYDAHGYEVLDLTVSTDNARFASVGGDKQAFLWDVSTAKTLRRFAGHYARINAAGFNFDASVLVTGSFDATVRLWDCKSSSAKPIMVFGEAKDSVASVVVGDGEVVSGSVDGKMRRYDLRMGMIYEDLIGHPITSITPTQDGRAYLISTLDSTIRLMDKYSGGLLQSYKGHTNKDYRVRSKLAFVDSCVVSGSEDGTVFAWDLLDGVVAMKQVAHAGKVVTDVAVHDGRKEMLTAGVDGTIGVWKVLH